MIPAKPTYYKGRLFRSKLESQWQAFFDLLGWRTIYEPESFSGSTANWLPDFAIHTKRSTFSRIIYAEVKPVFARTDEIVHKTISRLNQFGGQPGIDILLLGAQPIVDEDEPTVKTPILGWLIECGNYPNEKHQGISDFAIWVKSTYPKQNTQYDMSAFYGNPGLRIAGTAGVHRAVPRREINSLWARACNEVQWRPPKVKQS